MENRYIGENIRIIYDTLYETEEQNIPGMLLLLDFGKAFDSVSNESLNSSLSVIENFFSLTGSKINEGKTKIVWIGSKKYSPYRTNTKMKLYWIDDGCYTCLGITFSLNLDNIISLNYIPALNKVKRLVKVCSNRNITPLGKVTRQGGLFWKKGQEGDLIHPAKAPCS